MRKTTTWQLGLWIVAVLVPAGGVSGTIAEADVATTRTLDEARAEIETFAAEHARVDLEDALRVEHLMALPEGTDGVRVIVNEAGLVLEPIVGVSPQQSGPVRANCLATGLIDPLITFPADTGSPLNTPLLTGCPYQLHFGGITGLDFATAGDFIGAVDALDYTTFSYWLVSCTIAGANVDGHIVYALCVTFSLGPLGGDLSRYSVWDTFLYNFHIVGASYASFLHTEP